MKPDHVTEECRNDLRHRDDDFDLSPEEIASLRRSMQEANDGLTYEMMRDEEGNLTWDLKCGKCGRVGGFRERPFPHKLNCVMRRYDEVKD